MVADAPSSPSLSDPLPIAHCPSPPIPDALASRILSDLAAPDASLASVAQAHNISIADLSLWLTTPQARDRMLLIESGACTHTRMAASLNLTKAAAALIRVLDNYRALADTLAPTDPILLRASTRATKAAYHLYRLSRIVPVDPDLLATLPRPPARMRPQVSPPAHQQPHQQAHQQTRATPTDTALAHELIRVFSATAQASTPAASSSQLPTPLPSSPLPSSPSSALSPPRSSASSAFNSSSRSSRSNSSSPPLRNSALSASSVVSSSSPSPRPADLVLAATGPPPRRFKRR